MAFLVVAVFMNFRTVAAATAMRNSTLPGFFIHHRHVLRRREREKKKENEEKKIPTPVVMYAYTIAGGTNKTAYEVELVTAAVAAVATVAA